MRGILLQRERTSSSAVQSFGRSDVSRRTLLLLRVSILVLLGAGVSCLAAARVPDGVKRLPVVDSHDIRFARLASGGEVLNTWVRAITQDNQGFIWLGSDTGLYRYDGYVLKHYRHDPGDPNTVSSDEIRTLFRDREGMLWIGTDIAGLDRFDPARSVFPASSRPH